MSVFAPDNTRITSLSSGKPALSVGNVAGYLGQNLRFTVQAVGTIQLGDHEYDFQSEVAEFRRIVPAATPTNTPTSTSTNTPTSTPTNTPTDTPSNTPTSTPTDTPTRLPTDSPQLSYLISTPDDLSFSYNTRTDGGTISWGRSDWVPSKPAGSSAISYEVKVVYPNRTFGPYRLSRTRHVFTNLDVQESQRLRFAVTAVGIVKIGQHSYEIRSKVAEFSWTRPTSTPTATPTYTPTPTATNTATDTPTATSTSTATHTPTNTPTRLPADSPVLSGLISAPDRLSFRYDARTSSGTISWNKSKWVPSKPTGSSEITYEVRVISGSRSVGPYSVKSNSRNFTDLGVQESQTLKFVVTAVASIKIGPHTYEVKSKVVELGWTKPTATPTFTPTNTPTPTATNTPTPTRLPASHPRLDYTLASPSNLKSTFTSSGSVLVEWNEPRWTPKKPPEQTSVTYKLTIFVPNSSQTATRTVSRRSFTYSDVKKYAGKQLRFRVQAVGEVRIDGHDYEIHGKPAEGGSLYVPRYDYMLEQDESDSRLPGYCSIGLFLNRGRGYDFSVAYFGNTYKWYRVDVFGPDGRELDISSTRSTVLGDKANVQRYANTTFKPGVYTARTTELDPRRVKTFAILIKEQGDYTLQIGGWGC